ncbi:hypothetical protein CR513_50614, partial [Mucuna pruriens]
MTYTELLPLLLEQKLVEVVPLKDVGAIQNLLDEGRLGFQDQALNVQSNPFPTHRGVVINAVSHENKDKAEGASRKKEKGIIVRHTVNLVRRVEEGSHSSWSNKVVATSIAYIEGNNNPCPKPFIVHYNSASQTRVSFIVQVLVRLVYNNNAVPWRYPMGETVTPPTIRESPTPEVINIAENRGVMRSGRIFAPENLWNKDDARKKRKNKRRTQEGGDGGGRTRIPQDDPSQ